MLPLDQVTGIGGFLDAVAVTFTIYGRAADIILKLVALGSWVAVFPGTLESLLGIEYDFAGTWGTSRGTYELLTIGTLVIIAIVAMIGYAMGAGVRRDQVTVPIEPGGDESS